MKSKQLLYIIKGFENARSFPGGSDSEDSACRLIEHCRFDPQGRSPGEGHGYPLQYSCLGNPLGRGVWWATVRGVAEGQTQMRQLNAAHKRFSVVLASGVQLSDSVFRLQAPFLLWLLCLVGHQRALSSTTQVLVGCCVCSRVSV